MTRNAEPYYVEHEDRQRPALRRLWLSLATLPTVWALHLAVSYIVVSLACSRAFFSFSLLGLQGARVILLAVTVVAAAALLVAGAVPYRHWRRLREESVENGEADPTGRLVFISLGGALFAGYLLLAMGWTVGTILFNSLCELG